MLTKQRVTNAIGVSVLIFFVGVIVISRIQQITMISKTQASLDGVANQVANNNQAILMAWASGKMKDSWGHDFVLVSNTEFVQFASKGPDGILGSKDDIQSRSFPKKRYTIKFEKPPVEKSGFRKAWDFVTRNTKVGS